jgi:hypothetical protein
MAALLFRQLFRFPADEMLEVEITVKIRVELFLKYQVGSVALMVFTEVPLPLLFRC